MDTHRIMAWVVIFVDRDGVTTDHSLHMAEADALRTAVDIARSKWDEYEIETPFPTADTDPLAVMDALMDENPRAVMDALMDEYPPLVRLEVAPISVSGDAARTLSAAYGSAVAAAKHAERIRRNR